MSHRSRLWKQAPALCAALVFSTLAFAQHYNQTNLVSNLSGTAKNQDMHLKNPWGLTRGSTTPWWVSNNGDGTATLYDGQGNPIPNRVFNVPAPPNSSSTSTPTGVVFNGTSDFTVAPKLPALFIFVTEDGTISGWNPNVNPTDAVLKVNNSPRAVYKGVTLSEANGRHFLYVTNFRSGRVEVYDTGFQPVHMSEEAFDDDHLPHGYAPFGIQAVGKNIIVTFAKQDAQRHDDVAGPGRGFVDVFSPTGRLLARLQHGPWLNSPWGIALAPGEFGEFSHSLLIGNFGGGNIAAFNPVTGEFLGNVQNPDNTILHIDGLWALQFGNNASAGPSNTLFFTAGIDDEADGLFGTITPIPAELAEEDEP
jgi:uncharacterized protein (TIGR03118 family)